MHSSESEKEKDIRVALLGTWKLISVAAFADGEETNDLPYGVSPTGYIHYLADGRMAVVIAYDGRRPINGDRLCADAYEGAQAYATFVAYAGTYKVYSDRLVHHVEVSAFQNEVGSEQTRYYEIVGGRMHLTTVPLNRDGRMQVYKLVWEKVPAGDKMPTGH